MESSKKYHMRARGDQEAQEHPERHGLVREERHPVGISMVSPSFWILRAVQI